MNQCTFIGRITKNAELHRTKNNKPVTSFTLAVDRDFPNAAGEWETDFIDFIAFNKNAEKICEKYAKGDLITVTGRLQVRSYTNSAGEKRTVVEIVADRCKKITSPKGDSLPVSPASETPAPDFSQIEAPEEELPL